MLTILTLNTLTEVFICCNYSTTVIGNNTMEDEEHEIFDCPEYITCRLKYPELFNLTENNLSFYFMLMIRNLYTY